MNAERTKQDNRTAERILDIGERLVQTRGFNNFSYADIAKELGITTAGLHYHYPGKAQLGRALITRYAGRFGEASTESTVTASTRAPSSRHTRVCTPGCSRGADVHVRRAGGRIPNEAAQGILSTLEGAMLVSRPDGDLTRFNAAVHHLLVGLSR